MLNERGRERRETPIVKPQSVSTDHTKQVYIEGSGVLYIETLYIAQHVWLDLKPYALRVAHTA